MNVKKRKKAYEKCLIMIKVIVIVIKDLIVRKENK